MKYQRSKKTGRSKLAHRQWAVLVHNYQTNMELYKSNIYLFFFYMEYLMIFNVYMFHVFIYARTENAANISVFFFFFLLPCYGFTTICVCI